MYYLYISNCDESSAQTNIKVTGDVTWVNPYGYLPGEIATKLPVRPPATVLHRSIFDLSPGLLDLISLLYCVIIHHFRYGMLSQQESYVVTNCHNHCYNHMYD